MSALQALEKAIKAVLKDFGHLLHQDAQAVLGKISADIHAGTVVLTHATGDKLHSVSEALNAPIKASPIPIQTTPPAPKPVAKPATPKPIPAPAPVPTPAA